ncbi:alpha-amylase family glycosyl hydrolase [Halapricum hydrolyticum]|uniref:Alpha-amylase family glycosyl hydrolase n=1 Tax=Halapricum hydrolyticum TaxID=2979991 RepID=A0AAE3I9P8_9EURY|nr:alpha-amylase family glycosyl hydrolase [Halapricum hydrolyticum]MCU4716776.1 alpha-amylase family glycosyl hydrolase [Halapricum hydrolyticum]MCU4725619.1 alpha-amylase family glycosyl hydrolase [Halapricum hydrolyticum]
MHHPGPPRFTTVGTAVELAPRDPNPEIEPSVEWSILEAPPDSDVTLGTDAVEHFVPDQAGRYRLRMTAPDGPHELTVRAYSDVSRPARFAIDADDLPAADDVWISAPFNDHILGADRARREGDQYVFETELPPGRHSAMFVPGGNYHAAVRDTVEIEGPERPRIELDATVEDGVVTVEATPYAGPTTVETDGDLDVEFYLDDRDTLAGSLATASRTARCDLAAIEDSIRVHAVAVGARHSIADTVTVSADGNVSYPNEPPTWTDDATMYEIFTRSFTGQADPSFRALEGRVPYLEWLGIDTLWMTPILESYAPQRDDDGYERGGPHGYHTLDYFRTASDLGTREEFESFVETCHEHGIRVIFDLVVNHTSKHHRNFQLASTGVDDYREWYRFDGNSDPETYFNWSSIPNLNYDSLAVREFVLSVVEEWAPVVDGFRCDVAWGVPHGFWQEVRDRVKAEDGEFLLLDETIPRDPLAHENGFDLHYDTTLYGRLLEIGNGDRPAESLLEAVRAEQREGFPPRAMQLRYIENHDEDRYLDEHGRDAQRAAAAATLTLPGMPMVYYGQETGMSHYRKPMDWGGDDELTQFHRRLIQTRNEHAVLRRGDLEDVSFESETDRTVAFAREYQGQRVVVLLHFGDGTASIAVEETLSETDLVTDEPVDLERTDGQTTVAVKTVSVLQARTE